MKVSPYTADDLINLRRIELAQQRQIGLDVEIGRKDSGVGHQPKISMPINGGPLTPDEETEGKSLIKNKVFAVKAEHESTTVQ